MKTVNEVSKITGVSVRTLHYYDAIGLLKPTAQTEAGYRLYDDAAIARLRNILLYRELRFSLKDIKNILDSPDFDCNAAMRQQLVLLQLQKKHIENVISSVRDILENGGKNMDFSAFDNVEYENYAEEAKQRWGNTAEYAESIKKQDSPNPADMMEIFEKFGKIRDKSPKSDEAQRLVHELQRYITENFYPCSDDMMKNLAAMYTDDERFKKNIDAAGGDGTAEFVRAAIEN